MRIAKPETSTRIAIDIVIDATTDDIAHRIQIHPILDVALGGQRDRPPDQGGSVRDLQARRRLGVAAYRDPLKEGAVVTPDEDRIQGRVGRQHPHYRREPRMVHGIRGRRHGDPRQRGTQFGQRQGGRHQTVDPFLSPLHDIREDRPRHSARGVEAHAIGDPGDRQTGGDHRHGYQDQQTDPQGQTTTQHGGPLGTTGSTTSSFRSARYYGASRERIDSESSSDGTENHRTGFPIKTIGYSRFPVVRRHETVKATKSRNEAIIPRTPPTQVGPLRSTKERTRERRRRCFPPNTVGAEQPENQGDRSLPPKWFPPPPRCTAEVSGQT